MEPRETITRDVAEGHGWALRAITCHARRGDRVFEERHDQFVIAVVQHGMFSYHGEHGRNLLHNGLVLLGNAKACFACGHDHSEGDQCLALQIESETFQQLAFEVTKSIKFIFPTARVAMPPHLWPLSQRLCNEENAFEFASIIVQSAAAVSPSKSITLTEEQRIAQALSYLETRFVEKIDLATLSAVAGTSRFHFLRIFKSVVGMTPHQHILAMRLRHATEQLTTTKLPITQIALNAGFNDISTFNRLFKATYKKSPRQARA